MFKEITDFVNHVGTTITALKYYSANDYDEITDYPSFQLMNEYKKSFERIASNMQAYNTKLTLHFYIFDNYDPDDSSGDADFDTLVDSIIVAMTNYAALGYQYITILNAVKRIYQSPTDRVRGVEGDIELLRKENWQ